MSALRKNPILLLCLIGSVVLWGRTSFSETAVAEKTLSSDIVIKAAYQPGSGLPVGKIKAVRGEVIVFHRDPAVGYPVRTGLPLYQGDIIRTEAGAWIACRLVDGSQFALRSQTTLSILQSSLSTVRKTGASFVSLVQGQGRFKLQRQPELASYEFKIQMPTAFAVTGNADFVVKVNSQTCEIVAFDNSRLEVTGVSAPEDVLLLSDFQQITVREGSVPDMITAVSRQAAENMMDEFHLTPRTDLLAAVPRISRPITPANEAPGEGEDLEEMPGTLKVE
jgi:hypothetical protein